MTSYVSGTATIEWEGSTAIPNVNSVVITDTINGVAGLTNIGGNGALFTASAVMDKSGAPFGTVKLASTAAVSTDTALVVAVSPNNAVALAAGSATIGALTANQTVNLAQVGGTSTVNGGLAGSEAIGGTQANGAAITANPVIIAGQANAQGSAPAVITTTNAAQLKTDLYGDQYSLLGSAFHNTVAFSALSTTLTQQIATPASGTSIWITAVVVSSVTAASTLTIEYGTGTNCATGTTKEILLTSPLNTAAWNFQGYSPVGLQIPAAQAVCAVCGSATDTCTGSIQYYESN